MGYTRLILEEILFLTEKYYQSFNQIKMLECGNQHYLIEDVSAILLKYKFNCQTHIAKHFFDYLNIKCVSIDFNGEDNTYYCNLKQVSEDNALVNSFNLVTDAGTLEHIGQDEDTMNLLYNQYTALKNLHLFGMDGCIYYHALPKVGNWYKHGACDYDAGFWKNFCELCNYKILKEPFDISEYPRILICIVYRKDKESSFPSFEQFSTLQGLRSTAND
jgi:hypothetical protein